MYQVSCFYPKVHEKGSYIVPLLYRHLWFLHSIACLTTGIQRKAFEFHENIFIPMKVFYQVIINMLVNTPSAMHLFLHGTGIQAWLVKHAHHLNIWQNFLLGRVPNRKFSNQIWQMFLHTRIYMVVYNV